MTLRWRVPGPCGSGCGLAVTGEAPAGRPGPSRAGSRSPKRAVRYALPALLLLAVAVPARPQEGAAASDPVLRVVSYNAWHGRRTQGKFRLPGEDRARRARRYAAQIEGLREVAPDLLILQEVDPNPRRTRALARGLGMDSIHKVTSCGLHLGFLLKIPVNINEGLAILARPELGLRGIGHRLLSGKHRCWGDHFGFQTSESRYALLGEIGFAGRRLLVAATHLHAPPLVPDGFDGRLADLVAAGKLTAGERQAILDQLDGHLARTRGEAARLAGLLTEAGRGYDGVILGGDLNAEAGSAVVRALLDAGFSDPLAGAGDLVTFDPVRNAENYRIGARLGYSLETFGVREVEELLDGRADTLRRIDWILVSGPFRPEGGGVILDEERDGLFVSDHFGLLAELALR